MEVADSAPRPGRALRRFSIPLAGIVAGELLLGAWMAGVVPGPHLRPGTSRAMAVSSGSGRRAGPLRGPSAARSPTGQASDPAPSSAGPAPADPVSCRSDVSLAAAPDTGYDFLCTQAGRPLTWADNRISVYEAGLTADQSDAFGTAVSEWSEAAGFEVAFTASPWGAELSVTSAPLGAGASGYVEDAYTTVAYSCAPGCAYTSARMQLSSTATLTGSDWVSTILHELGHVAGLNHVSEAGEVMYPYLVPGSPVAYRSGDLAGFAVLAAERGAWAPGGLRTGWLHLRAR